MKELKASMYLRLSRDDGDEGESNSILNQRELIKDYASKLNIEIVSEYVDDGFSGSNFDRPEFKKMMKALEKGEFNTIIVKDLSRFGRDYIETGKYIQKIFPEKGVRFISVNDNYDSDNADVSDTHLILPIKNFINDSYCRDISMKVKSSQKVKRQRGEFIGAFAPYGYVKDSEEKNHLVIDDNVAHVVKKIFKMKIEGYSSKSIADSLTKLGVPTPKVYKDLQGIKFSTVFNKGLGKWDAKMVNRIIENRVYTGTLVQGKTVKLNYKSKKQINVLEEDWIIAYNTHEAIITDSQFAIANKMMTRDLLNSKKEPEMLSGLLYCKDCGHQLTKRVAKRKNGVNTYYICGAYNKGDDCSRHSVEEKNIMQALEHLLVNHIKIQEKLYEEISKTDYNFSDAKVDLGDLEAQKSKFERLRKTLYLDLEDELISEEEFETFRKEYKLRILEVEEQIVNRISAHNELREILKSKESWLNHLSKYTDIENLDRYSLVMLVDKIIVDEKDDTGKQEISVIFNDSDKINMLSSIVKSLETPNDSEAKAISMHRFLSKPVIKNTQEVRVYA